MINREDMLELTRRMNVSRNSLDRIAGAYMDEEGYIDGTFNIHFKNLKGSDLEEKLGIAKAIPFSRTNVQLREYAIRPGSNGPGSIWQLLEGIKSCGLKNDAMMETLYELIGERYPAGAAYAILVYHGCYDVPVKAQDKEYLEGSEETYEYLICAICPLYGNYQCDTPRWGFLYPAFKDHQEDWSRINVYEADPDTPHTALLQLLDLR